MARYNTVSPTTTTTTTASIATPAAGLLTTFTGTAPYTVTLPNPMLFAGQSQTFWNNTSGVVTVSTPSGVINGPGGGGGTTFAVPAGTVIILQSDGTNYVLADNHGGVLTATSGTFSSSLGVSGNFTASGANATIGISPTGTGTVTISPAGALTMNPTGAISITGSSTLTLGTAGQTTTMRGNISATTNNQTVTLSPTGTGTVTINPASTVSISPTGALTINPTAASTMNNVAIGGTTRAAGAFTTLAANNTVTITGSASFSSTVSVPDPTLAGHAATKNYIDTKIVWATAANLGSQTIASSGAAMTPITFTAFALSGDAVTYSLVSGSWPSGTSFNTTTGVLSGNPTSGSAGIVTYTPTVRATVGSSTLDRAFTFSIDFPAPPGQQLYEGVVGTNGGSTTYTWTAPSGVTSVSIAAIGGGGGGCYTWAVCGGAGGGLVWANGVPVTPGASYTIQAGNGGCWSGSTGGCSCFPNFLARGGACGCCSGCYVLGGSYTSGCGSFGTVAYPSTAGGGGGGGGYCNNQCWSANSGYTGCHGGGGSSGAAHSSTYGSGGGGGTGICGQGTNGACGNAGYSHQTGSGGQGGSNGTCGNPGEPWSNGVGNGYGCGGNYGGGGGGGGTSHGGGWGGRGAVRIMWGGGRSYPSNAGNV